MNLSVQYRPGPFGRGLLIGVILLASGWAVGRAVGGANAAETVAFAAQCAGALLSAVSAAGGVIQWLRGRGARGFGELSVTKG